MQLQLPHGSFCRTCLGTDGKRIPTFSLCVNGTLLPPNLLWGISLPSLLKRRLVPMIDTQTSRAQSAAGVASRHAGNNVAQLREGTQASHDAEQQPAEPLEGPITLGTIWARSWLTHILREFNLGGTSVEAMSTRLLETLLVMRYAHLWVGSFAEPASAQWEGKQQGRGEWVHVSTPHGAVWRCRAGLPALQPHGVELLTVCCVYAAARLSGFFLHMKDLLASVTAAYADPRLLQCGEDGSAKGPSGEAPEAIGLQPGTLRRYDSTGMQDAPGVPSVPLWIKALRSTFRQYNLLHVPPAGQDMMGAVFGPPHTAQGLSANTSSSSTQDVPVLKRAGRFRHPAQQLTWPIGSPRPAGKLPMLPHTMLTAARSWRRFYTSGVELKWDFAHPALLVPEGAARGGLGAPTADRALLAAPATGSSRSSSSQNTGNGTTNSPAVHGPSLPPARHTISSVDRVTGGHSSPPSPRRLGSPALRRSSASQAMFRMASNGSATSKQLSHVSLQSDSSGTSRPPRLAMKLPLEALLPMVRASLPSAASLHTESLDMASARQLSAATSFTDSSEAGTASASTLSIAEAVRGGHFPWLQHAQGSTEEHLAGSLLAWPSALSSSTQQRSRAETDALLQSALQLSGDGHMSFDDHSGSLGSPPPAARRAASPSAAPTLPESMRRRPQLLSTAGGGLPGVPQQHAARSDSANTQPPLPAAPPSLDLVRAMTALTGAHESLITPLTPSDSSLDPHTWVPPPHVRAATAGASVVPLPPRSSSGGSMIIPPPPTGNTGDVSVVATGRSLSSGAVMEGGSGFSGSVVGVKGMSAEQEEELARLSAQLHSRLKSRPGSTRHSLQSPGQVTPRQLETPRPGSEVTTPTAAGARERFPLNAAPAPRVQRRCSATAAMAEALLHETGDSDDDTSPSPDLTALQARATQPSGGSTPDAAAAQGDFFRLGIAFGGAPSSAGSAVLQQRSAAQAALLAMPRHTQLQLTRSQESNQELRNLSDMDDRCAARESPSGPKDGLAGGVPTADGCFVAAPAEATICTASGLQQQQPVTKTDPGASLVVAGIRASACRPDSSGCIQPGAVDLDAAACAMSQLLLPPESQGETVPQAQTPMAASPSADAPNVPSDEPQDQPAVAATAAGGAVETDDGEGRPQSVVSGAAYDSQGSYDESTSSEDVPSLATAAAAAAAGGAAASDAPSKVKAKRRLPGKLYRRRTDSDLVVGHSAAGVVLPRTPRGAALSSGGLQLMRQGASNLDTVHRSSSAQAWSTVMRAASGQADVRHLAPTERLDDAPLPCRPPVAEVSEASDVPAGLQPTLRRSSALLDHSSDGMDAVHGDTHEVWEGGASDQEGGPSDDEDAPPVLRSRPSLDIECDAVTGTVDNGSQPLLSDASQLPLLSPGEPCFEESSSAADLFPPMPPPMPCMPQLSRQSSQMDVELPAAPPQPQDDTQEHSSFGMARDSLAGGEGLHAASALPQPDANGRAPTQYTPGGGVLSPGVRAPTVAVGGGLPPPRPSALRTPARDAMAHTAAAAGHDCSKESAVGHGSVAEYYHSVFVPHISQLLAWLQSFSDV